MAHMGGYGVEKSTEKEVVGTKIHEGETFGRKRGMVGKPCHSRGFLTTPPRPPGMISPRRKKGHEGKNETRIIAGLHGQRGEEEQSRGRSCSLLAKTMPQPGFIIGSNPGASCDPTERCGNALNSL